MLASTLQNNKNRYLAYNALRKKYFLANSPKDSPIILYMLPWLLSVNRQSVPGYIKELKEALDNLVKMKSPSLEEILRKRGFCYEANIVKDIIESLEKGDE